MEKKTKQIERIEEALAQAKLEQAHLSAYVSELAVKKQDYDARVSQAVNSNKAMEKTLAETQKELEERQTLLTSLEEGNLKSRPC